MELETLLYEQEDGVAVITMNRPEVHNAFNHRMQAELHGLWRHLRRNEDVRAVVLTGAGDEAFCVGIDRDETIQESYLAYEENRWKMQGRTGPVSTPFMFNDPGVNINPKTNDLWKPIIAAVNGMACGGALYMLGESDIIIAAEHATFFDPHVTYGMVAGFESIHLLQKLPLGEVLRMMLLGAWERMSAERAHQMGLVSEVVPQSRAARAGHVGGAGHRLGAGDGDSGHAARHLDDPRAQPARGAVTGLDLRRPRDPLRQHRGRPGDLRRQRAPPRVAAPLRSPRCAPSLRADLP